MAAKYTDTLELAFDQVKAIEQAGKATPQQARMAQFWCLIAIAVELRLLRQEISAAAADLAGSE